MGVYGLIILTNLALIQGIFGAYVYIKGIDMMAFQYFFGQALVAGMAAVWFAWRVARYPRFLSYPDGLRVYVPCMILSLALPLAATHIFGYYWGSAYEVKPMLLACSLFLVMCLAIKLHGARHAFAYSLTEW